MRGEDVRSGFGFIAPVEGLRGVAILLVMLFHYALVLDARFADPWVALIDSWLPAKVAVHNGYLGVDLFFLITGFLLVLPWLRDAGDGGAPPSALAFYRRRVHRILPAYYVQLLLVFFVVVPLVLGLEYWRNNPAHMATNLATHVFLVHYLSPVTSASLSVNGALWTLSLEAQFYLLLPLLAPVFARAPWRTALAMLAVAVAWRWLAHNRLDGLVAWLQAQVAAHPVPEATVRHLLWTQLPGYLGHFAAGMLAARAWLRWRGSPPTTRASLAWLAAAAAAMLLLWLAHAPGPRPAGELTWVVVPIALGLLMAAFVSRASRASVALLANPPLLWVGRVSYSAYLYHLPVLLLWNAWGPPVRESWLLLPAYAGMVLAIAWVSYRRVEVPGIAAGRYAGVREREVEPTLSAARIASTCSAATPHST